MKKAFQVAFIIEENVQKCVSGSCEHRATSWHHGKIWNRALITLHQNAHEARKVAFLSVIKAARPHQNITTVANKEVVT